MLLTSNLSDLSSRAFERSNFLDLFSRAFGRSNLLDLSSQAFGRSNFLDLFSRAFGRRPFFTSVWKEEPFGPFLHEHLEGKFEEEAIFSLIFGLRMLLSLLQVL
ncbi:unnamed protein product [Rhizophagus irregularis]|nr:unnamed protein product [Rhizophagus irregularis]